MKIRSAKMLDNVRLVLFLLFFALTVFLNLTCSEEDNPLADPECGSGHVTWYEKAGVCRDEANNQVVPNKCCGR